MSNFSLELDSEKALATVKVVLGAAWADGSLQPEEIPSLKKVVLELGLADHPEIRQLIQTPVSPPVYRHFFQQYLALHPTPQERNYLLNVVTRLIYADDEVSVEEAYILEDLRKMVTENEGKSEDEPINFGEFQAVFGRLIERLHR